MLDIENKKYSVRKEYEYDDDIAVLFYKGVKVARDETESFRKSWVEESWNGETMSDFLENIGANTDIELDEEDENDSWENIWDELDWNEETKSYKYKNWEWIVLDI